MPSLKQVDSAAHSIEPDFFSAQVTTAERFYRNLNPEPDEDLAVVAGGRERCDSEYEVRRGCFAFYGIEFVVGGRGRLVFEEQEYELRPGCLFGYGPEVSHAIYSDPINPLEKYFVDLAGQQAAQVLHDCSILGQVVQTSSPATILKTFEEISHYGLSHSPLGDRICSALIRLLSLKVSDTALTVRDANSPAFGTYQRCRNEINVHYLALRSLSDIAGHCHIDPAYICRLFQRYDSQSPYQYLLRRRMNYAAQLLLESGLLVKEVADRLGFDDPYHFSRTFKKVMGLSPSHFGRMHQS